MANLSTARKLSIVAKVAAQQAGRTRTLGAFLKAGRITSTHVGRVLHQLWLEVTGFVFLVLAVIGASALVHEYHKYHAAQISLSRVLVTAVFTAVFAWFGVSSFWRVRKKR
jgi:phosphate/sulfate permease